MTTYDLDTLTLTNIGEEVSNENRLAWSGQFLAAYNEAYQWLCANVLKPTAGCEITLNTSRQFSPATASLRLAADGILSVKQHEDYSPEAGYAMAPDYGFYWSEDGYVTVPGVPASSKVYVIYRCLPTALSNPTPTTAGSGTEPALLPGYSQAALSHYAAAAFFRARRKYERMQVWTEQWMTAIQGLDRREDTTSARLNNLYRQMP